MRKKMRLNRENFQAELGRKNNVKIILCRKTVCFIRDTNYRTKGKSEPSHRPVTSDQTFV